MKTISLLVGVLSLSVLHVRPVVGAPAIAQAEEDPLVSAKMSAASAETVLSAYAVWTRKKVEVPTEIKKLKTPVTLVFDKIKRSEAIQRAERALLEQGAVEILRQPDGSFLARLASNPRR